MQNGKKKLFGIVTLNKYGNPFRRKLFIFFMLLIPIANFLVFTVYANLGGIVLSFHQMSPSTGRDVFVGIANYKKFFEEFALMQYGRMILVSFGYLFVVMFLSLPISLVLQGGRTGWSPPFSLSMRTMGVRPLIFTARALAQ